MNPPLFKIAFWTGTIGVCAYFLRRVIRRRTTIDVGIISAGWLAHRRGISDESVN